MNYVNGYIGCPISGLRFKLIITTERIYSFAQLKKWIKILLQREWKFEEIADSLNIDIATIKSLF